MHTISPYQYPCSQCTRLVDERFEMVWHKVTGWEHKRDAGGTNHLALRRPQNEFMCDECMEKLRNGLSPQQGSLLAM